MCLSFFLVLCYLFPSTLSLPTATSDGHRGWRGARRREARRRLGAAWVAGVIAAWGLAAVDVAVAWGLAGIPAAGPVAGSTSSTCSAVVEAIFDRGAVRLGLQLEQRWCSRSDAWEEQRVAANPRRCAGAAAPSSSGSGQLAVAARPNFVWQVRYQLLVARSKGGSTATPKYVFTRPYKPFLL